MREVDVEQYFEEEKASENTVHGLAEAWQSLRLGAASGRWPLRASGCLPALTQLRGPKSQCFLAAMSV